MEEEPYVGWRMSSGSMGTLVHAYSYASGPRDAVSTFEYTLHTSNIVLGNIYYLAEFSQYLKPKA